MQVNREDPLHEQNQQMYSRSGKSTNNLYLAFQDKERLNSVQSKVAAFLGKDMDQQEKDKEAVSQFDNIRSIMKKEDQQNKKIRGGMMSPDAGDLVSPTSAQGQMDDSKTKEQDLQQAKQKQMLNMLAHEMKKIDE